MRVLLPVALVAFIGLTPIAAGAQVTFRSGSGMNPGGPGPGGPGPGRSVHGPARSSAPPSRPLPVPFAGTVPDPIIRPAMPNDRRSTSRDVFRAGRFAYAPRYGRWSALSGGYAGGYGAYYDTGGYASSPTVPPEPAPDGRLALFVTPGSTQVYVDGFYTGTVADYQDRGMWLESGPHHIELRGDGYQTESFDVRIDPDRPAEYRRDLTQSTGRSDAPRAAAATPKTFYVIPGCYAGDTPPQKDRLPDGCSARNVRTVPPVVNRIARR